MDPPDFIFLVFSHKCLTENNSNLGTYGSGNLLPCGAVAQRHVARGQASLLGGPMATADRPTVISMAAARAGTGRIDHGPQRWAAYGCGGHGDLVV